MPSRGSAMSYETILFSVDRGVARLTLNRPDKLNSFNTQMHARGAACAWGACRQRRAGVGSDRCRARLLRRPGSRRSGRRARRAGPSISANRSRSTTSPWCWRLQSPAHAGHRGGQWRRRRRRRQHCARLRSGHCGALGELRAGVLEARAGSGFGRHVDPAAARRELRARSA